MSTTRQTIVRGPGCVKIGSLALHDASGITVTLDLPTQDINASTVGKLDTIKTDQIGKVALTPCGTLTAGILAALYPHGTPSIGSSLMGSTDVVLLVNGKDGRQVKFFNGALTKIPDLILSPIKTAFGSCEFTALLANGKLATDADGFMVEAAVAYADGDADSTGLSGINYVGTWGAVTIADTLDGWTISVDLGLQPVVIDNAGTIDYTLTDVTVRASCTPVGLTAAQIVAALPAAIGRGASTAGNTDLVITGAGGITATLKNASLVTGPLQWGSGQLRLGQLGFIAHRTSAGALYSVALASA